MTAHSRRAFLRSSAGGLASALFAGHALSAADPLEVAPPPRPIGLPNAVVPADTLFLTWFRDPTTTIVAQWLEYGTSAIGTVRVRPLKGDDCTEARVEVKPFGPGLLTVHRAEVVGLTPGTEYVLQLGDEKQTHRFRTMPAKATDTFTWVAGGDCGTGPAAVRTNTVAAKQEPYFAFVGGDFGYDNGTSVLAAFRYLNNYAKHMIDPKGRLIPVVTCIGNHEVRGGYKAKRSDATYYLPLYDGFYKDVTYGTLDFGDYLSLVLLDTGHIEPIEGEQTDWLDKTLAAREGLPHLFVGNRVPAYPSYRAPEGSLGRPGTGAGNRKHWSPLFEKYRVDAVLEHHDHTFKRTHPLTGGLIDKYGVPYLGDGSWGQLRTPVSPEKRPYLLKVAKVNQMTVHRLEGEQRYHVAIDDTGRVVDVCGSTGKRPSKRG